MKVEICRNTKTDQDQAYFVRLIPESEDELHLIDQAFVELMAGKDGKYEPEVTYAWGEEALRVDGTMYAETNGLIWGVTKREDGMTTVGPDGQAPVLQINAFKKGEN